MHPELILMQDGAAGHTARATMNEFLERGIEPIAWPPFSSDFNLIEMVWNVTKDYIQDKYDEDKMTYPRLRAVVTEAWNAIDTAQLDELIDSMPRRCQALIAANGNHTKF